MTVTTEATKYVGVSARDLPCLSSSSIFDTNNNNNRPWTVSGTLKFNTF